VSKTTSPKKKSVAALSSDQLVHSIATFLDDHKALDLVTLPLVGKSSIADYLVIASGTSQRHLSGMAQELLRILKVDYKIFAGAEGLSQSDWILIDVGDVIVHLFRPEVRAFYNLEKMWDLSSDEAVAPDVVL
jgi:ribosome-associated protein